MEHLRVSTDVNPHWNIDKLDVKTSQSGWLENPVKNNPFFLIAWYLLLVSWSGQICVGRLAGTHTHSPAMLSSSSRENAAAISCPHNLYFQISRDDQLAKSSSTSTQIWSRLKIHTCKVDETISEIVAHEWWCLPSTTLSIVTNPRLSRTKSMRTDGMLPRSGVSTNCNHKELTT